MPNRKIAVDPPTVESERRGRRLLINRRLFFFGAEEFEGEATVLDISTNGCRATSLTEVTRLGAETVAISSRPAMAFADRSGGRAMGRRAVLRSGIYQH